MYTYKGKKSHTKIINMKRLVSRGIVLALVITTLTGTYTIKMIPNFAGYHIDSILAQDQKQPEIWSIAELESIKSKLSDYEKNLYKLVILTKDSMDGYGSDTKFTKISGVDKSNFLLPLYLGTQTMEGAAFKLWLNEDYTQDIFNTPMTFYKDGRRLGVYQLSENDKLQNIGRKLGISSYDMVKKVKEKYKNTEKVDERLYYPYATLISVSKQNEWINWHLRTDWTVAQEVDNIADSFGLTGSKSRFKLEVASLIGLTRMQDESLTDAQVINYYAVLAGIWAYSSDIDSERGFHQYSINDGGKLNLSKETILNSFYGGKGIPLELYKSKDISKIEGNSIIYRGGNKLSKPLWSLVFEKYPNNKYLQEVESSLYGLEASNKELYNYHYGIVSYLEGKQILNYLDIKKGTQPAKLVEPPKPVNPIVSDVKEKQEVYYKMTDGFERLVANGGYYKPFKLLNLPNEKRIEMTYFTQTRGIWAPHKIMDTGSYTSTYAAASCGYTSMAMIISSINEDSNFTPLSLKPILQVKESGSNIVVPFKGYNHNGMNWYIDKVGLKKKMLKSKGGYNYSSGQVITRDSVKNLIDNGGVAILSTSNGSPYTGGGHMVLLVGYTTDDKGNFNEIIIQDPNIVDNSAWRFGLWSSRVRVDKGTGLVYDNYLRVYESIPTVQMRYASAHFIEE